MEQGKKAMPDERPECDKMVKVKPQSQAIGQFLEWLDEQNIQLATYHVHGEHCTEHARECGYSEHDLAPHRETIEELIARHFNIDMEKVEAEKRALLIEIRASNR